MKKLIILPVIFFFSSVSLIAQLKIGYVDSDTIMDNLPDVQDTRQKIDALVREWQNELKNMENEYNKKKDDFDKRNLIMTDQTRADAQKELDELQTNVTTYRNKKFGQGGELFQKQDELMKPIHNKIFNAIQQIAADEDLDFVFDRSGDIMLLYAKEQYDITAKVIEKLNLE